MGDPSLLTAPLLHAPPPKSGAAAEAQIVKWRTSPPSKDLLFMEFFAGEAALSNKVLEMTWRRAGTTWH